MKSKKLIRGVVFTTIVILGVVAGLILVKPFYDRYQKVKENDEIILKQHQKLKASTNVATAVSNELIRMEKRQSKVNMQDTLCVEAYLMYDDGSRSNINLIDNKSVTLWNTIIGEGDAGKPSNKLLLVLKGNSPNLALKVTDSKGVKLMEQNISITNEKQFIIDNTGCTHLVIQVTRENGIKLEKEIPFECGE